MKLRRVFTSLVAVAVLVTSCATTHVRRPVNAGIRSLPHRAMHLHADTGFTPGERGWISMAMHSIVEQSAGVLMVDVTYDLDFDSMLSVASHATDNLLIRAPADAPYVVYEDAGSGDLIGVVGGVDLDSYDPLSPKQVYLVADRLMTPGVFVHVAMHETLHAFGLKHVDDADAVMFPTVGDSHPSVCISRLDANELCRMAWCRPEWLNYCE